MFVANPKTAAMAPGLQAAALRAHDEIAAAYLRAATVHLKAATALAEQCTAGKSPARKPTKSARP